MTVDPTGKFAYVANEGSNNVSMYSIDAAAGALTLIGTIAAGVSPFSVAVDPSGKFAYVANSGDFGFSAADVSMYTIDATSGMLTSIGPPMAADFGAISVTVDPFGKFAYVANAGNGDFGDFAGDVSMYTIDASSGALASAGTIAAGYGPESVAVHPSGKFAYVANDGGDFGSNVSMYAIDTSTGVLTSIGPNVATAGFGPVSVTVHPSGNFAYVTNGTEISWYTINTSSGTLTPIGAIAEGGGAVAAVHPSGKFAYVLTAPNNVSMYAININTGALTSIGTAAAGLSPTSIAIDPSGQFAYVTNYDSNNVSMYRIDAVTGLLTIIGTIGT
jgi:YVTN family beta-propeller protein